MEDNILDRDMIQKGSRFEYANFGQRLVAVIIDGLIQTPIIFLMYYNIFSIKSMAFYIVLTFFSILYKPLFEGINGATPGKSVMGLKVVGMNGEKIDLGTGFLRSIFYIVSGVLSFIPLFMLYQQNGFEDYNGFADFGKMGLDLNENIMSKISTPYSFLLIVFALIMLFNDKKQALYDMIAKTLVVVNK